MYIRLESCVMKSHRKMMMTKPHWSMQTPNQQGWFWYRKNDRYHPAPTFVEDCGNNRFRAVDIYHDKLVFVEDADVEWWTEKIEVPAS